MKEQWQELKETITELRDNDGIATQQEVCKFLANLMDILEKQMQEPCEMTVEEYRQRMIQAFHNADTDELIAICALPTEKEFEHLEWLLKNHYKKEPCEDAISREAAQDVIFHIGMCKCSTKEVEAVSECLNAVEALPPVTPQPKTGHWISGHKETGALGITYTEKICSNCGWSHSLVIPKKYCPNCGAKMIESEGDK